MHARELRRVELPIVENELCKLGIEKLSARPRETPELWRIPEPGAGVCPRANAGAVTKAFQRPRARIENPSEVLLTILLRSGRAPRGAVVDTDPARQIR